MVNNVTGKVNIQIKVYGDNAINLGTQQMNHLKTEGPMVSMKIYITQFTPWLWHKQFMVADTKDFDPEVTYARAMGLQSSTQVQDTKKLVSHELSSYPPPMFDKKKHMGQAKS